MYWPADGVCDGAAWPLSGLTLTRKSTPASAEPLEMPLLLWFLELMVTSVKRPMTAEGLMTNTLPLPLLVLIPALALPMQSPCDAGSWQVPVPVPPVGLLQVAPELLPKSLKQSASVVHEKATPAVEDTEHCCPPVMEPLLISTHPGASECVSGSIRETTTALGVG